MKGKFTHIVPLIILCLVAVFTVASCVSPVNIGDLLSDGKIQDMFNPNEDWIKFDPPGDLAPVLEYGPLGWTLQPLDNRDIPIPINYGHSLQIRVRQSDGKTYSNHIWYLEGYGVISPDNPALLIVNTGIDPFDIYSSPGMPVIYRFSLSVHVDGMPYSTYFFISTD